MSILLDIDETVSRVADVEARWGGVHWYVTDAYRVVAKAQAKKIYEWGSGVCSHGTSRDGAGFIMRPRRECDECWLELLKEING